MRFLLLLLFAFDVLGFHLKRSLMSMKSATHVVVFTPSLLRLHDNTCLKFSKDKNAEVVSVFVRDELLLNQIGTKEFIDQCVHDLALRLASKGGKLQILEGSTEIAVKNFVQSLADTGKADI